MRTLPLTRAAVLATAASLVAASLVAVSGVAGATTIKPPRRIVTGWLPYWTSTASTADVVANRDLFRDVSPFWFTATSATAITANLDSATRATQTAQLHAAGIPVYPTVTDGLAAHAMAAVLANATTRSQHVAALVATVLANGYDGIDLDYEKFAFSDGSATWAATRPNWVAFVAQLGTALHAQGRALSVTVPYMTSATSGYWVYDYAAIGAYLDRMRIMTYDWSTSRAGPIAPISWVDAVAAYASSVVPASKVQIGVASYGYDWPATTTGCPVDNMPVRASYSAAQAIALATALKVAPVWNTTYDERTFSYRKTYTGHSATGAAASCRITRTVWYDDRSSALLRATLVAKYRLGGVAFWAVGGEDPGQWAMLRAYASTIAPDPSTTGLSLSTASVVVGQTVVIHGQVVRSNDHTAIVGAHVLVQARQVGATTWQTISSLLTSSTGTILVQHVPVVPTQYRIVTVSSWDHYGSASGTLQVAVARSVSLVATAAGLAVWSVPRGTLVTLIGDAQPRGTGLRVYLQRWTGTAYAVVGSTVAVTNGIYSFVIATPTPGTYSYRTFVYGDAVWGGYSTPRVSFTVT